MEIKETGEVQFFGETMDFETFISIIRKMSSKDFYDKGFGSFAFWRNLDSEYIAYDEVPEYYRARIYDVLNERKREELKDDLYNKATSDNSLPEDIEEKELLADVLREKIKETKAEYKDARKTKLKYLAVTLLSPVMLAGSLLSGNNPDLGGLLLGGSIIFLSAGSVSYLYYKSYVDSIQYNLNKNKRILSELNIEEPSDFEKELKENEFEDKVKVKKYNDKFINEVAKIARLINKLPDNQASVFRDRVNIIVDEYQRKINEIIDREDKITMGKATDAYTLLIEMLPDLYKIERELLAILGKEEKKDNINEEIEEVRSLLQGNKEHLKKAA